MLKKIIRFSDNFFFLSVEYEKLPYKFYYEEVFLKLISRPYSNFIVIFI